MTDCLEVKGLACSRGGQMVLNDLSFSLKPGEVSCLLGPSGSGKTTLLRCLSGLERPEKGTIRLNGRLLNSPDKTFVEPEHRKVGMVFQESSLFPHLSLKENMVFGLSPGSEGLHNLSEMSEVLGVDRLLERYPNEVSGGQRQRAALGRALLRSPELLLMDEPFSHLDSQMKSELLINIGSLLRDLRITTLVVTHSREDAFDLADNIGVLLGQKICHWGSRESLYYRPETREAAKFMGMACLVKARAGDGVLKTPLGEIKAEDCDVTGICEALVFPERVKIIREDPGNATILARKFRGSYYSYFLELSDKQKISAVVLTPDHSPLERGERVRVEFRVTQSRAFSLSGVSDSGP